MNPTGSKVFWIVLIASLVFLARVHAGPLDWTSDEKIHPTLTRGKFPVLYFPAKLVPGLTLPKALIVFGSGCGGWSYWEENVCRYLEDQGYEVLGVDFALYARSDYNLSVLQADYGTIIKYAQVPLGSHRPPVILGGWSTGAEQAVAVAGGPHPPAGLVGLLLISPGSEGGYGTYAVSYLDLGAPASKLFKIAAFAPNMSGLRIAQWHAEFDPLDSCTWLQTLKAAHHEYVFPGALHDYHGACPEFLSLLDGSISWILGAESAQQPRNALAVRKN